MESYVISAPFRKRNQIVCYNQTCPLYQWNNLGVLKFKIILSQLNKICRTWLGACRPSGGTDAVRWFKPTRCDKNS